MSNRPERILLKPSLAPHTKSPRTTVHGPSSLARVIRTLKTNRVTLMPPRSGGQAPFAFSTTWSVHHRSRQLDDVLQQRWLTEITSDILSPAKDLLDHGPLFNTDLQAALQPLLERTR